MEFGEVTQAVYYRLACPCLLFLVRARQGLQQRENGKARIFVCLQYLSKSHASKRIKARLSGAKVNGAMTQLRRCK